MLKTFQNLKTIVLMMGSGFVELMVQGRIVSLSEW